jgi:hypothetical protein
MKVVIEISDDYQGVVMNAKSFYNGVNDHTEQSIAFLLVLQLQRRILEMSKKGVLQVKDEESPLN